MKKIVNLEFNGWKNEDYKTHACVVGDIHILSMELASRLSNKTIIGSQPYVQLSLQKPDNDHEHKLYEFHNWTTVDINNPENWVVTDNYIVLQLGNNPFNHMVHSILINSPNLLHNNSKQDIINIIHDVVEKFEPTLYDEEVEDVEVEDIDDEVEDNDEVDEDEEDDEVEDIDEDDIEEVEDIDEDDIENVEDNEVEDNEVEVEDNEDEVEEDIEEDIENVKEDEVEEVENVKEDDIEDNEVEDIENVEIKDEDVEIKDENKTDNKEKQFTLEDLHSRNYKIDELKNLLRRFNLKISGNKKDLIERLEQYLK